MIVKLEDRTYTVWIHFGPCFCFLVIEPVMHWSGYRETPVQFISDIEQNVNGILRRPYIWDADGFLSRFSNSTCTWVYMNYKLQPKFKVSRRVTAYIIYFTDQIVSAGNYRLGISRSRMWPAAVY